MNSAFLILYSFEKKRRFFFFDEINQPFSNFLFKFNGLIKGNDFSLLSFEIFQFFFFATFHDKLFLETKKHLIKKEVFISSKEIFSYCCFLKKFKNFSIWNHKNWLFKKETFFKIKKREKNFYKKILIDQKNIHAWNFFFKSSIFLDFPSWKILTFLETLESADFFNNSPWHYKVILLLRSKNLSKFSFKFFKKKNLHLFNLFPDILWEFLIKILKIMNSRIFIIKNYFIFKKKTLSQKKNY